MIASYCGHSHVFRILPDKGANVSLVDGSGVTALHASIGRGHLHVIETMLLNLGAYPEERRYRRHHAAHLATQRVSWIDRQRCTQQREESSLPRWIAWRYVPLWMLLQPGRSSRTFVAVVQQ